MLWGARKSYIKERKDFETEEDYACYIGANAKGGVRVEAVYAFGSGVQEGEQGTVVRNTNGHLEVSWDNGSTKAVKYHAVKLLASVDKKLFVAD